MCIKATHKTLVISTPEMQDVLGSLDIFNVTNLDLFNVTTLDIFNVTKFDIVNATKQRVSEFEQEFHRNPIVAHLKTLSSSQESQKNRYQFQQQFRSSFYKLKCLSKFLCTYSLGW